MNNRNLGVKTLLFLISFSSGIVSADTLKDLLGAMGELESARDPKCLATASRLEDFMYGTPLSEQARMHKIDLQKNFLKRLLMQAERQASADGEETIGEKQVDHVLSTHLTIQEQPTGDIRLIAANDLRIDLQGDDLRQYASVAYSLRAILALQQERQNLEKTKHLPLSRAAIDRLRHILDVTTLAALQLADQRSRLENAHQVSAEVLEAEWHRLVPSMEETVMVATDTQDSPNQEKPSDLSTLEAVIRNKITSYQAYNKISMPVFLRNIQVYFARYRWPTETEASTSLKIFFNEAMIAFTRELYLGSQALAVEKGHPFIRIDDVSEFAKRQLPHEINEYEDAIFFPTLNRAERVSIESYDMDAFRDSGLHWRYLQSAIDDARPLFKLEPDPFASEVLVENIAQFGVLLLRMGGLQAQVDQAEYLTTAALKQGLEEINRRIERTNTAMPDKPGGLSIASADAGDSLSKANEQRYFEDITTTSGVGFHHGSADWLSRMIRSYTVRNREVAVLAVPPAFGGSGIASEDIDSDGLEDLLILGGHGNKLYKNLGNGKFTDITKEAGLEWLRPEDGFAGEPRQPLIADFDNDGREDILITYVNDDHRLYKNLGEGRFQDVTAEAGLGGKGLVAGPAVAADFDNDGLLDIYIGYFGEYIQGVKPTLARRNFNGLPNQLFKNIGGLRFKNITEGSGVDNRGWTQALTHTDFNRDGRQDLIVGNDFGINAYLMNLGNGKFKDVTENKGTDKPSYTMNIGIADLNDDLLPDVYISNIVTMDKDQKYVLPGDQTPMKIDAAKMAKMRVVEANDLFLSEARDGGLYAYHKANRLMGRGASSTGWSWGASFLDVDNDTDSDLYVVNGMNDFALYSTENPYYKDPNGAARNVVLPQSNKESNVFFINEKGSFYNVSPRSGVNLLENSRAVTYLDFELDGDLDMVMNNYHGDAVLYRNNAEQLGNHWIEVKLIGDPEKGSNRDAVGARIIATTPEGRRMWREIRCGESYLTVHPKTQHFGLGRSEKVNLTVEWPNGERMEIKDLGSGFRYMIDQKRHAIGRLERG